MTQSIPRWLAPAAVAITIALTACNEVLPDQSGAAQAPESAGKIYLFNYPARAEAAAIDAAALAQDRATKAEFLDKSWVAKRLRAVHGKAGLEVLPKDHGRGTTYVFTRTSFDQIDEAFLKAARKRGVALVGIGLPVSKLANRSGASANMPDLEPEFAHGRVLISLVYEYELNGVNYGGSYSDYWDTVPENLFRIILPKPYSEQLE